MATATSEVNEFNAYRYGDNWTILNKETDNVYGCEHNETEAKAIASYLNNRHGGGIVVVHNRIDLVRRAREIRGDVVRVKDRESILEKMGVGKWV